jgi:hypothetical protein
MNKLRQSKGMWAAWLAVAGWWLPTASVFPDDGLTRPVAQPVIHDIRLDLQGTLHGKLIDLEGRPVIEETLELIREGQTITRAISGQDGQFRFAQVAGGIYQIRFGSSMVVCRVWTDAAAPPVAKSQLIVLEAAPVVRGQQPVSEIFRNPLFIGLLVAAAIAIPVAVHQSQGDKPSGS